MNPTTIAPPLYASNHVIEFIYTEPYDQEHIQDICVRGAAQLEGWMQSNQITHDKMKDGYYFMINVNSFWMTFLVYKEYSDQG